VLLLVALLLQAVLSMRLLSATFDETTHLPSGYVYLTEGDFRLNPQHPPLAKLLSAAPLWFLEPSLDRDDRGLRASPPDEWGFGFRFLYGNDADRLLFWGRLPIVLLALLLAWYVYRWARDLFGRAAGFTALTLCVFSPTLIAHSRFVTFDVPLACFSTMALYHLWRYVRGCGWSDLVLAGCGLGLSMATKFSGALLWVSFALLLVWSAAKPPTKRNGPTAGTVSRVEAARRGIWGRIAIALFSLVVVAALVAIVIQASYFFSDGLGAYWAGLKRVNADHDSNFAYYLMGQFKPGGWWYYFLFAFVVKTPLPTLLLLGLSVVLLRRFPAPSGIDEAFLLLPIVVFVAATSAFADNLGVRYLLPVYPLLFVFVSRLAQAVNGPRWARGAGAVLATWYVVGALWIYPDHLAYFNELVGGPANGHRYLDDSNIDWGQDLKRLRDYLRREGIQSVKLRYGRNVNPDYYGIPWRPLTDREWSGDPPAGVYAVGTHLLIRGRWYARQRGLKTDWLERYEPIGRVGYSCYLFRFE
jgi:4-amino-4-deoxy-L-arabinose transferase-like glycosyltransferase